MKAIYFAIFRFTGLANRRVEGGGYSGHAGERPMLLTDETQV
jgi:hypothetical protein